MAGEVKPPDFQRQNFTTEWPDHRMEVKKRGRFEFLKGIGRAIKSGGSHLLDWLKGIPTKIVALRGRMEAPSSSPEPLSKRNSQMGPTDQVQGLRMSQMFENVIVEPSIQPEVQPMTQTEFENVFFAGGCREEQKEPALLFLKSEAGIQFLRGQGEVKNRLLEEFAIRRDVGKEKYQNEFPLAFIFDAVEETPELKEIFSFLEKQLDLQRFLEPPDFENIQGPIEEIHSEDVRKHVNFLSTAEGRKLLKEDGPVRDKLISILKNGDQTHHYQSFFDALDRNQFLKPLIDSIRVNR